MREAVWEAVWEVARERSKDERGRKREGGEDMQRRLSILIMNIAEKRKNILDHARAHANTPVTCNVYVVPGVYVYDIVYVHNVCTMYIHVYIPLRCQSHLS